MCFKRQPGTSTSPGRWRVFYKNLKKKNKKKRTQRVMDVDDVDAIEQSHEANRSVPCSNSPLSAKSPLRECPVCSTLPLYKPRNGEVPSAVSFKFDFEQYKKIKRWRESEQGKSCFLSALILKLNSIWVESEEIDLDSADNLWEEFPYPHHQVTCSGDNVPNECLSKGGFQIAAEYGSLLSQGICCQAVFSDMLSESSLRQVEHWITKCSQNHPECSCGASQLPTRLLDILDIQNIRLLETSNQLGSYIALSHCWGQSNSFVTTAATIEDMKMGFHIDRLPATFRDAVRVTQVLGQRYLWIDSLCIVQGDPVDWAIESSKMGDVYANSFLTIAASMASDDCEGFLARSTRHVPLNIESSVHGTSVQVFVEFNTASSQIPLLTRAWTLQERYLPPRILHFEDRGLIWECLRETLNEELQGTRFLLHKLESLRPENINDDISCHSWHRLVSDFSQRYLTYDTDKLPAISGLATKIAVKDNLQYCAGIWWQDVMNGLLWYSSGVGHFEKPSGYLAPSWSWASLNGAAEFSRIEAVQLPSITFTGYDIRPVTTDKYGKLHPGGHLKLRAAIMAVAPMAPKVDEGICQQISCYNRFQGGLCDEGLIKFELVDLLEQGISFTWTGYIDLPHENRHLEGVSVLPLAYRSNTLNEEIPPSRAPHPWESLNEIQGIMIKRSRHAHDGYERIGYFSANLDQQPFLQVEIREHLASVPVAEITLY